MDKAYVETTILAECLLKAGPVSKEARKKIALYKESILPVYAIKEWKAGQLTAYVYVHNKLQGTGSFSQTNWALSRLYRRPRYQSTAFELWAYTAGKLPHASSISDNPDQELADRFRLIIRTEITRAWSRRRKLCSATVDDLECYTEAPPKIMPNGLIEVNPRLCHPEKECCLAAKLRAHPDHLSKIRDSIPQNNRPEDIRRRQVLRDLIKHPRKLFTREDCMRLGDAVFVFFAPEDADILTTNGKDFVPMAKSVGKSVSIVGESLKTRATDEP
jgi:hypothetical protein